MNLNHEKLFLFATKYLETLAQNPKIRYHGFDSEDRVDDDSFFIIELKSINRWCDMEIHEDGDILCGYTKDPHSNPNHQFKILQVKSDKKSIETALDQMKNFVLEEVDFGDLK